MGATPNLKLPWPELTDNADGPDAVSDLAVATEGYFYNRALPAGIVRSPSYHWGAGTTYPTSGVVRGDTFQHTGLSCLMVLADPGGDRPWVQAGRSQVSGTSQVNAMSTNYSTVLHNGFETFDTANSVAWRWNGSQWEFTGYRGAVKESTTQLSLFHPNGQPQVDTSTTIQWPQVTLPSIPGLLSMSGDNTAVICQVRGRVRVEALSVSDSLYAGSSNFYVVLPAASAGVLGTLEDLSQRSTAYPGAGILRQTLAGGPFTVNPGDRITAGVRQTNTGNVIVSYQHYLNVTYVG